ncbi:tol-pal system protein YbgF [Pseudoruegeria sp. SHC-113]|uniref:tol-pal system protein YbgF n=1 Tax=Pseudoruegeria sp. SHC-113 TaxID=2855439 RepID=UPI0021BAE5E9|nr:tol-pal system protein YbgF [Pseudoruegeria sp. SHC-113]MCT8160978.1 tol-pal system protein YbgF [Pseudoruegeria sp. SHC-113]
MKRLFSALLMSGAMILPTSLAFAQDRTQTLADIRQELSVVYVEIQKLKRELSTTGAPGGNLSGNTPLERLDAIEREVQRLTSATEDLEFRVNAVAQDGANRIGDLEFRLVELEGGDLSKLGETSTLGGLEGAPAAAPAVPLPGEGPELAIGEKTDFETAKAAFDGGDYRTAADQFQAFTQTYPGSPLSAEAHYLRGQAHEALGEMSAAARAFLDSFSGTPDGALAPDALFKLGASLAALGQTNEACVTLSEVQARFPAAAVVSQAQSTMSSLGCS